jgi:opacity protein-like surface antigen
MKKILILAVLALALAASPVTAREGLYMGAGLVVNSLVGNDVDAYDAGTGLGLRLGYNFGQVALEGNLVASDHTTNMGAEATFGGFSLDLRVFLSQDQNPAQPYFLVGLGGYSLEVNNWFDYAGGGFNLGMGMEYYLDTNLAFDVSGIYRFIGYDELNGWPLPQELDGDTFTLAFGMNYHF